MRIANECRVTTFRTSGRIRRIMILIGEILFNRITLADECWWRCRAPCTLCSGPCQSTESFVSVPFISPWKWFHRRIYLAMWTLCLISLALLPSMINHSDLNQIFLHFFLNNKMEKASKGNRRHYVLNNLLSSKWDKLAGKLSIFSSQIRINETESRSWTSWIRGYLPSSFCLERAFAYGRITNDNNPSDVRHKVHVVK